ncbi:MAG: DUF1615 domain-containing protein [Dechloromonas sp.]|uniref:DUF1615 domain-containing protein n=1 Tax=Candidatus Dechloromonas phosphorivorans TaxID=2899244 RepID=A0A9D7LSQ2_9RHOO|nr:DUF1615 domain-containing protein [Candidatus Dechloromonas phosphorivorans]
MFQPARAVVLWLAVAIVAGCAGTGEPIPGGRPLPLPPDLAPSLPGGMAAVAAPPSGPEIRAMVVRLIPASVRDRSGWADDLYSAFSSLDLPHAPQVYCAAIAIIEQESSFQADPVVPDLPDIVWRELEQRGRRYGIPKLLISAVLLKTSPDGRSYSQRIDALRTEKQLNGLFEDMIAELPAGKTLFAGYNPVRTGGPMQVSIAFAEEFARERSYPYPVSHSIRDEVFSRRGGLYFGSAILLDYPAPYDDAVYRFADFNAGRYSSRNAAFQAAVARVSGKPLALDGDLLLYRDGKPQEQPSAVEGALQTLSGKLPLSLRDIRRDLLLEKSAGFGQSPLFARLFVLAEQAAGSVLPRQTMPQIELKSPKFTRKLTTEWFARRVEGRYRTCLTRS